MASHSEISLEDLESLVSVSPRTQRVSDWANEVAQPGAVSAVGSLESFAFTNPSLRSLSIAPSTHVSHRSSLSRSVLHPPPVIAQPSAPSRVSLSRSGYNRTSLADASVVAPSTRTLSTSASHRPRSTRSSLPHFSPLELPSEPLVRPSVPVVPETTIALRRRRPSTVASTHSSTVVARAPPPLRVDAYGASSPPPSYSGRRPSSIAPSESVSSSGCRSSRSQRKVPSSVSSPPPYSGVGSVTLEESFHRLHVSSPRNLVRKTTSETVVDGPYAGTRITSLKRGHNIAVIPLGGSLEIIREDGSAPVSYSVPKRHGRKLGEASQTRFTQQVAHAVLRENGYSVERDGRGRLVEVRRK